MNSLICSADRATHLKIVVLGLISAIAVAGFALVLHSSSKAGTAQQIAAIKARAAATASNSTAIIR
jgi:hypothetical protein